MIMNIDAIGRTFNGGHDVNEDSIICTDGLYVVADGLGGHFGGETGSAAAVKYISENRSRAQSGEEINALLEGANQAVNALANDSHTTVAAAFIQGETLRYANVGDSRVYIFRRNRVYAMTKDHSVCRAAVDMGEMSFEDIRFSDDRSRLLKVLGNGENLNLKNKYDPIELYDGDAFLICSDGFWEYIHEREMEADLLKADSAEAWSRLMLKRHLLKAKNKGDNYSVVCGIVHSDRMPPVEIPKTTSVSMGAPTPAMNTAPGNNPAQPMQSIPVTAPPAMPGAPFPSTMSPSHSKAKTGIIVAVAVAVAVIGIGIIVAAILLSRPKPEIDDGSGTTDINISDNLIPIEKETTEAPDNEQTDTPKPDQTDTSTSEPEDTSASEPEDTSATDPTDTSETEQPATAESTSDTSEQELTGTSEAAIGTIETEQADNAENNQAENEEPEQTTESPTAEVSRPNIPNIPFPIAPGTV